MLAVVSMHNKHNWHYIILLYKLLAQDTSCSTVLLHIPMCQHQRNTTVCITIIATNRAINIQYVVYHLSPSDYS